MRDSGRWRGRTWTRWRAIGAAALVVSLTPHLAAQTAEIPEGSWEPGFNHSIDPNTFPYGTDPTIPFQNSANPGSTGYQAPPPPPTIGEVAGQPSHNPGSVPYTDNYFWGQHGIFGPAQHRQAFNAVHMALIPKGLDQGKVLVWGGNMPVRLRPNSALDNRFWFCQPWAVIDPSATPGGQPAGPNNPRIRNYLLPLRAQEVPTPPPSGGASYAIERVPVLFCSGHAWSQNGDLVVAGGEVLWRYATSTGAVPAESTGEAGARFLCMFDPALQSQGFPGSGGQLYADTGNWAVNSSGLILDRYYPTVTLSQILNFRNPPGEDIVVSGGSSVTVNADNTFERFQVFSSTQAPSLVPVLNPTNYFPQFPTLPTGWFWGPNAQAATDDEKLGLYPRQHLVGNIANSPTPVFPLFLAGPEKLGARVEIGDPATQPAWDTAVGVGRNPPTQPLAWDHERHDGASLLMCYPGVFGSLVVRLGGGQGTIQTGFSGTDTAEYCTATAPSGSVTWAPLPGANQTMPGGPRQWPNAVALPDGSILVIGGADPALVGVPPIVPASPDVYVEETALYRAGIGWHLVEGGDTPTRRGYHSTAVLLPDGRVFVGGGELILGPQRPGIDHDYDIYVPHYLQGRPERPVIASVTDAIVVGLPLDQTGTARVLNYTQQFAVLCDIAPMTYVDRVVLIAPGSITHHSDMSSRYVHLQSLAVSADKRLCQVPDNGTAPRGFYMMFAVNSAGIPSVAKWIKIE